MYDYAMGIDCAPAVVMDCGTGFTKLGLAGNTEPQEVITTAIGNSVDKNIKITDSSYFKYMADMNYNKLKKSGDSSFPVVNGQIENWDDMERFWTDCIFRHLRVTPECHPFLLTETALAQPESREQCAEIMFETFNVPKLSIQIQSVLSLYANANNNHESGRPNLTGTVVDVGEGCTQIVPIIDGYVVGQGTMEFPVGGKHVTEFVNEMIKNRNEWPEGVERMKNARNIKEQYCYLSRDMVKEMKKFDAEKHTDKNKFKRHQLEGTQKNLFIDIGYERFLAPEIFFHPELCSERSAVSLPVAIDQSIQKAPIDVRRKLYENIVVTGGSSGFANFSVRCNKAVKAIMDARVKQSHGVHAGRMVPCPNLTKIKVVESHAPNYSAWFGGSVFATMGGFDKACITRKEYAEYGPSLARKLNAVKWE